jgi:hypothetical protein
VAIMPGAPPISRVGVVAGPWDWAAAGNGVNDRLAASVYLFVTSAAGQTTRHRYLLSLLVLVAVALVTGGAGANPWTAAPASAQHHHDAPMGPDTAARPSERLTVQQLATTIGCAAKLAGKAADFRQASCTAAGARFVLLDFDTAKAQRAWLDEAIPYGGVYLVGDRWALSGESALYLRNLQVTLGGAIEEGASHG